MAIIGLKATDPKQLFPISWICESKAVLDYVYTQKYSTDTSRDILVADFASGENDKIPYFFHLILPSILRQSHSKYGMVPLSFIREKLEERRRFVTYSTDLHGLRLDSLFHMFQEERILEWSRAVHARLETMELEATFRQPQADYLLKNEGQQNDLDRRLLEGKGLGEGVFDLGFLNNDVVGYIFEYYKVYTDALASLKAIRKVMRDESILLVTQPCSLYPVDNVEVLTDVGFSFVEGKDVDMKTGEMTAIEEDTDIGTFSQRGHYTFLVFRV